MKFEDLLKAPEYLEFRKVALGEAEPLAGEIFSIFDKFESERWHKFDAKTQFAIINIVITHMITVVYDRFVPNVDDRIKALNALFGDVKINLLAQQDHPPQDYETKH